MGYSLITGGTKWTPVASISGLGAFREWVSGLEGADELKHLVEYGWSQNLDDLESQLAAALESSKPSKDVASTATAFLEAVKARDEGSESAVLTDGLTEKDDPDKSGWQAAEDEPAKE